MEIQRVTRRLYCKGSSQLTLIDAEYLDQSAPGRLKEDGAKLAVVLKERPLAYSG
jgi:hypothetical protein